MNFLKSIILAFLLALVTGTSLYAQSIDQERMNRDIHIMESILQEMFKVEGFKKSSFLIGNSSLNQNDVRGTYLPGYGAIFQIADPFSSSFAVINSAINDDTEPLAFFYSGEEAHKKTISEETIQNRIITFLKDYGSTIGQLGNNDKVMIIFGGSPSHNYPGGIKISGPTSLIMQELPIISISAKISDLKAYKKDHISESTFEKKLSISSKEKNNNQNVDLKVMANILDTALEDNKEGQFRTYGSPDYQKVDGFGVIYYLNVLYNSGFGKMIASFDKVGKNLAKAFDADTSSVAVKSISWNHVGDKRSQKVEEESEKAFANLKQEIKDYIVDYGPTLKSINSKEYLLVSINVSSSYGTFPDRLDLQLKKSVLEAVDKGSISRQQAMNKITMREY